LANEPETKRLVADVLKPHWKRMGDRAGVLNRKRQQPGDDIRSHVRVRGQIARSELCARRRAAPKRLDGPRSRF
jgi:hypothetical protein